MKRAIYRGLVCAGRALALANRTPLGQSGSLRVIMYHRVAPERAPLVVTPDSFAAQQELLARQYQVVSLDQVVAHVRASSPLPPRAVLLTFDDGYRDNLELAKPILDHHGHAATIFIPTAFIGSDQPLPHDRRRAHPAPTLTWDELRTLATSFSIGSHGCSHRIMTSLSADEAKRELYESKRLLEAELGRPVIAFSYPKGSIGDFNSGVESLAAEAGYEVVFTTLPGINRPGFDRRRIRRHNVEDYGIDYFESLLDGSAELLSLKDTRVGYWAKKRVNGLRLRA